MYLKQSRWDVIITDLWRVVEFQVAWIPWNSKIILAFTEYRIRTCFLRLSTCGYCRHGVVFAAHHCLRFHKYCAIRTIYMLHSTLCLSKEQTHLYGAVQYNSQVMNTTLHMMVYLGFKCWIIHLHTERRLWNFVPLTYMGDRFLRDTLEHSATWNTTTSYSFKNYLIII